MWNNSPGYPGNSNAPYPPPSGYGEVPSFPSPGGFGPPMSPPPPHTGYTPSYVQPQGPTPGGFPNPGGLQNPYPPPNSNSSFQIPNPSYQQTSGLPSGQYPSPAGPPPTQGQYRPPPGPPHQPQFQPPPGPQNQTQFQRPSGHPVQTQFQPPSGHPNQTQFQPSPAQNQYQPSHNQTQYQPPSGHPNQNQYQQPPGPPNQSQWKQPPGPPPQQGQPGSNSFNQTNTGYPGSNPYGRQPAGPPSQGPPSFQGNHPPNPPTNAAPHMPSFERQYVGTQQGNQFSYQYSKCNGKKKALCIGVNYRGQQAELKGCINDALNVKRFLIATYGYKEQDIVMLTDDASNPRQIPTARNMIDGMRWLVSDAKPNDSLFFHFSGHGGQTKDLDGDEEDGYDEVIYPVDFKTAGHIVDDAMHEIMVKPLPPGCRLTAIFDCCHSGSALDLPYMYSTEGKLKEPNMAADIGQGLLGIASSYAKKDMGGLLKGGMGVFRAATGGAQKAGEYTKKTRTSPADVISWSGCKDSQTSADTVEAGKATGAMSFAFISVLTQNRNQTYQQLLNNIRDILRSKYSQKPQLAASHPIDTNAYFIC